MIEWKTPTLADVPVLRDFAGEAGALSLIYILRNATVSTHRPVDFQ